MEESTGCALNYFTVRETFFGPRLNEKMSSRINSSNDEFRETEQFHGDLQTRDNNNNN